MSLIVAMMTMVTMAMEVMLAMTTVVVMMKVIMGVIVMIVVMTIVIEMGGGDDGATIGTGEAP